MTWGRRPSRPGRRAFTLLEVVLSLAIAVVLVAAMYHVMFQLASATERGDRVAEQAQLARTLLDRIAADIRASASGTGVYNAGMNGDGESLQLFAHVVPAELDFREQEWAPPPVGNCDLVEINYFLQHEDEEDPESPVIGLARSVRRQLGALEIDEETDTVTELLAEEVAAIRFRYALRGEWIGFWQGSRGMGAPRAVEIVMVVRQWDPEQDEERLPEIHELLDSDEVIETDAARGIYRLVVLVPVGGEPDRNRMRRAAAEMEETGNDFNVPES